ncbi:MAG: hypothetical protein CMA64_08685 [Euryarchaeota archaeon]|jgi:aconitase B|nr:hypothetical protein [Euryarchaeota archaeon]
MENLYASTNVDQVAQDKPKTQDFFNGYFNQTISIDPVEQQAVKSFFLKRCNDDHATANTLTDSLFEIAVNGGLNVMVLIDALKDETMDDVQKNLIAIVNNYRVKTSVLGFANSRTSNPSVLRNIVE